MPDILVIFGAAIRPDGRPSGTLRRRVWGAHRFGRRLRAPYYLVTGGVGRYGPAEALVMKDQLLGYGVPPERIIVEDQATDTLSSAEHCAQLLGLLPDRGAVYVCSSPFHIPRCRMLLHMLGVVNQPAAMPSDRRSLGLGKWLYYIFREGVALPYDYAIMAVKRRRAAAPRFE